MYARSRARAALGLLVTPSTCTLEDNRCHENRLAKEVVVSGAMLVASKYSVSFILDIT